MNVGPLSAVEFTPLERAVLDWIADRRMPTGLLGRLEWWNLVDWVEGHGFDVFAIFAFVPLFAVQIPDECPIF